MKERNRIRKAVIPAAGLGTRLLPATKAIPKEMFPILAKPAIQYVVEEALASGIEAILFILNGSKSIVEDYFRGTTALDCFRQPSNPHEAELACGVPVSFSFVRQEKALGLAHAIGCARQFVRDEPFAVLLPDVVFDSGQPALQQLMDCYKANGGCIVATQAIAEEDVQTCGILETKPVDAGEWNGKLFRVSTLVEKPRPEKAPSRYAVIGRYVFEPDIFAFIDRTQADIRGEMQITDSLRLYCELNPLFALLLERNYYDVGDVFGLLRASIEFGLRDAWQGTRLQNYIRTLKLAR